MSYHNFFFSQQKKPVQRVELRNIFFCQNTDSVYSTNTRTPGLSLGVGEQENLLERMNPPHSTQLTRFLLRLYILKPENNRQMKHI